MKISRWILGGLTALALSSSAHADELDPPQSCAQILPSTAATQKVVYVNGIQVESKAKAWDAVFRMRDILCPGPGVNGIAGSHNHAAARNFQFQVVYNPIGWDGLPPDQLGWLNKPVNQIVSFLEGVQELMQMKTAEEFAFAGDNNLLSCANGLCNPHNHPYDSSLGVGQASHVINYKTFTPLADLVRRDGGTTNATGLTAMEVNGSPPNMVPTTTTIDTLTQAMKQDGPVIVVAHSQGNLIANWAYAQALIDLNNAGQSVNKRVRVVNVANTSAFSINNLELTQLGDKVVFDDLGVAVPMLSWRSTSRCPDGKCPFLLDTPTLALAVPSLQDLVIDAAIADLKAEQPELAAFLDAIKTVHDHLASHYMDTYLSDGYVVRLDLRGVPAGTDVNAGQLSVRFRDHFEDLVYAATSSIEAVNAPPPQTDPQPQPSWQGYINTDFSGGVSNMYTWGSTPRYDSTAHAYVIEGTDGFGVGLPPDLMAIHIKTHMMFIATSSLPNQFGYGLWSTNPGVSDAVFIDFFNNANSCGNGNAAYSMSGNPSPWQCGPQLNIDTTRLVNMGWVTLDTQYDRRDCTMRISITPDDGSAAMGGTVDISGTPCSNPRGSFVFTPGAPNPGGNAMLLFDHLEVSTFK